MPLDIPAIQRALADDGLDGWLLYDFHGSNPIAQGVTGLAGRHTTRRWYYFIPTHGTPRKLVHAIEPAVLAHLPGDTARYAGRLALSDGVGRLVAGARRVAMEFSPGCAIPYISRVDGGTIDMLRELGLEIASSGDLVGRFEAAWGPDQVASHRAASVLLHQVKDQAFAFIGERLAGRQRVTEFDVQTQMMRWFAEAGLITDHPPIVGAGPNSGDPHYAPAPATARAIERGQVVLLDLWGKLSAPEAVYADITWTGVTGPPDAEVATVFTVVAAGRDAALERVQRALQDGLPVRGFEVDRAARDVIAAAGYGEQFVHRTGHSLGREVHGNGVHMDDYETHDDRRLIEGTGFTIEPGVYLQGFGIRSEINVVVGRHTAPATGPCQRELVRIL